MSTIHSDVASPDDSNFAENVDFDPAAAFLDHLADKEDDASKKKPSDTQDDTDDTHGETDADDAPDDESPEASDEQDELGNDEPKTPVEKKYVETDDHFVKLKVGDEEKEVSVKDLKRLYGQEASLTRKSTDVAEARKSAEAEQSKYAASLNVLLTQATEQADPYRNIDWMAVSKDPSISAEAASALRAEAQRALDNEAFLGQNLNGFMQEVQARQHATRIESAKACVKALTTPGTEAAPNDTFIEGWNEKIYDEVRTFGVKMGLPQETVNTLTDPAAIKMMHMAMLYKRGAARVQTTKVNNTPKKIVKTSSSPAAKPSKGSVDKASADRRLAQSGSVEDAGAAFLARFTANS